MLDQTPTDTGATRRALVRGIFGRPGSFRRWFVGTLLWLFACLEVSKFVPWGARLIIFVFALLVPMAGYRMRSMLIGDEDEFRDAAKRERARNRRDAEQVEEEMIPLDSDFWLSIESQAFADVPPPPILDDEPGSPAAGEDT